MKSQLGFALLEPWVVVFAILQSSILLAQANPDPKLTGLATAKCYVYANWAGAIQPDASSTNSTKQLLAEPELQAFFKNASFQVSQLIAMSAANTSELQRAAAQTFAPTLLPTLLNSPGTMFIGPIEREPNGLTVSAGLVLKTGENATGFAGAVAMLLNSAGGDPQRTELAGSAFNVYALPDSPVASELCVGSTGPYLILALGQTTAEAIVDRLSSSTLPTPPVWLSNLQKGLSVPNPMSFGYINIGGILQLAAELGGPDVSQMLEGFNDFGIAELVSLESAMGLDDKGLVNKVHLRLAGPPRGLVKLLAGEPLDRASLEQLPKDCLFAAAYSIDLKQGLNEIRRIAEQLSPQEAEQFDLGMQQIKQNTGIDLEAFLEDLGSTWTLYNAAGDGLFTGLTLTVDLDNAEGVQATIAAATEMLSSMRENGMETPSINPIPFQGTKIYRLRFPGPVPIEPSFAIVNDRLILTLYPQGIKPHIAVSPLDEKLDLAELGVAPEVSGFTYTDSKRQFEVLYMYASLMFGMLPAIAEEMGLGAEQELAARMMEGVAQGLDLPSARSIYRHLQPSVSMTQATDDGILFTTHQTMPSLNIGVAAPVAVALLLPAVQAAREAARRMQSTNNLKQHALAMHNFESAYRRLPAAFSTDKDGRPLLSWRVHILPFIEQSRLYEEFHLDEPWDSEHNLTLLERMPAVYRSPSSQSPPNTTTYRAGGGEDGALTEPHENGRQLGRRFADFTDGTSNTLLVIEASDALAVEWTRPDMLEFNPEIIELLFGTHTGGTNAALCDGSVHFLSELTDQETLRRLFNIHDGEIVNLP